MTFEDLKIGDEFRFVGTDGPERAVCVKVSGVRYRYAGDGWRYPVSPFVEVVKESENGKET